MESYKVTSDAGRSYGSRFLYWDDAATAAFSAAIAAGGATIHATGEGGHRLTHVKATLHKPARKGRRSSSPIYRVANKAGQLGCKFDDFARAGIEAVASASIYGTAKIVVLGDPDVASIDIEVSPHTQARSGDMRGAGRGAEITFPRDELRQVVESFKYFPHDLFPKAQQTAAVQSAEHALTAALRAGRFPVSVRLTLPQVEAVSELVLTIDASAGGPEDLFSEAWAREPRLRAAWHRVGARVARLVEKLGLRAWEMV